MSFKCPICGGYYMHLSQHLRVTHKVFNVEERKLLLALESGRVDVRKGRCPVPGCQKEVARMDRHLHGHSELSAKARRKAFAEVKRVRILEKLAALRADGPAVPMASTLDLQREEEQAREEAIDTPEEDDDEQPCGSEACERRVARLRVRVCDLEKQVDTLTTTLQAVTRRCKQLLRRQPDKSAADFKGVTQKLLQALESPVEDEEEAGPSKKRGTRERTPRPSSPPPQEPPAGGSDPVEEESATSRYPEHSAVLNQLLEEYRLHQQGPEPSRKLKENVAGKIYRIRSFIGHMAAGKGRLSTLEFLDNPGMIRK
nr:uncharacterized protein LOC129435054 [Misgurnus anguillicaudatus]